MTDKDKSNDKGLRRGGVCVAGAPGQARNDGTSLRPIEAHRVETSQDTTTEFVSQGPHGSKAPSGRRGKKKGLRTT